MGLGRKVLHFSTYRYPSKSAVYHCRDKVLVLVMYRPVSNKLVGSCISCVWRVHNKPIVIQSRYQEGQEKIREVHNLAGWIHREWLKVTPCFQVSALAQSHYTFLPAHFIHDRTDPTSHQCLLHTSPYVARMCKKRYPIVCLHNNTQHPSLCHQFHTKYRTLWSSIINHLQPYFTHIVQSSCNDKCQKSPSVLFHANTAQSICNDKSQNSPSILFHTHTVQETCIHKPHKSPSILFHTHCSSDL